MNRSGLIDLIGAELSGDRMLQWAREMTSFYRSPGASGYHQATDFVAERFRRGNLDRVWTERFPLDGKSQLLNQTLPLAWEPVSAELRINSPLGDLLIAYEDAPSCLPWWTPSTPEGGMTLELVDVGTGERDEDYESQDVRGKAVLIHGTTRPTGFAHASTLAMSHGAAGIITDYLLYQTAPFRTRESLPEPVQLLRMPSIDNSSWAIAVDYTTSKRLASLAPCKVWANIQTRTFSGEAKNLFADIVGTDKSNEYVMFVCHSTAGTKPGANCASGPALLIEMGQVISQLISSGAIPRPRRTIRFLVDVEGHGSKHYIQNHRTELENTVTAIAVDSVGHDQQKCKSALIYYHSPDSLPSFINDYYVSLMESTPKETRWVFHTENSIPLVNFIDLPYTPWSDNKYYPVFGVPSPLLMSWPDLYFHTQLLTADVLDPAVFYRCAMTTTLAAIELAKAGPAETQTIMREVATRSHFRLGQVALNASGKDGQARQRLRHIAQRDQRAIDSALRLVLPDELNQNPEIEVTKTRLQANIANRLNEVTSWLDPDSIESMEYEPGTVVPKRMVERDPPGLAGSDYWDLYEMSEEMHATDPKMNYDSLRIIGDEIWNFTDGHRNVNQITEAIGAEFNFDLEPRHVLHLFQGLASLGYVTLDEPTG